MMMKKLFKRLIPLILVVCMCLPFTALAANTYYLEITIREADNSAKIVKSTSAGYLLESELLNPLVVASVNERYEDGSLEDVFQSPAMRDILVEGLEAYDKKVDGDSTAWDVYLAKYYEKVDNLDPSLDLKALMVDFTTTIGALELDQVYEMKFKNEVEGDPKYGTTYIVSVERKVYSAGQGGSGNQGDVEHICPSKAYSDLNTALWYHEAIDFVLNNGMMNGVGDGKFDPNGTTTRAMVVTILWRLEGKPEVTSENPFEDVEENTWYTEAVIWAAGEGVVLGYGDDNFGPMDVITREQMATILYRYAQWKGYDVSVGESTNILSYEDALEISEWAISAMQWACGAGVMRGVSEDSLDPSGYTTRAQAAQFFMNFCTKVAEQ